MAAEMEHFVDNQDEALEVITAYLERMGVAGLRQPYHPDQINKSAVIRFLINEKLQQALANPPAPDGERHRVGQTSKKSKASVIPDHPAQNMRKGSKK